MMYHLSYLDIKHGIQRGGGQIPPPSVSWFFKYPSRDRVKYPYMKRWQCPIRNITFENFNRSKTWQIFPFLRFKRIIHSLELRKFRMIGKPQLKIVSFHQYNRCHRSLLTLHGGSLEISLTVPLTIMLCIRYGYNSPFDNNAMYQIRI